jgi:hypothetical protein
MVTRRIVNIQISFRPLRGGATFLKEGDMKLSLPQEIKTDTEKKHVVENMHHDRIKDGARSRTNPGGKETEQEYVRHNDRITVHRGKKRCRDADGDARR